MALQVDYPNAALIVDLIQKSLLRETLIVWAGEFGRTPESLDSLGRKKSPGVETHRLPSLRSYATPAPLSEATDHQRDKSELIRYKW